MGGLLKNHLRNGLILVKVLVGCVIRATSDRVYDQIIAHCPVPSLFFNLLGSEQHVASTRTAFAAMPSQRSQEGFRAVETVDGALLADMRALSRANLG